MKKQVIAAAAASIIVGISAQAADITVTVNGEKVDFPNAVPFIENDRTLVPMRAIFEALGADVQWDEKTRTVISYSAETDTAITMQIDNNKMFVNEKEVILEVPAKIVNDSTVVPVRAVSEAMDCKVDWNEETKEITIIKAENTGIANPWTDCKSLEELNSATNSHEGVKYVVTELKNTDNLKTKAFRYMADENMSEILYSYEKDGIKAEICVRTAPGDADISGVYGAEEQNESYLSYESLVDIYKSENILYAVWSTPIPVISHSVSIKCENVSDEDMESLLKSVVEEVNKNFPRG